MSAQRFDVVDVLRGVALVWMTGFHFAFDLNYFGHWRQDFYNDPFWTSQRTVILGSFIFCAGLGQAIALEQGQSWARFWRRWAQVLGCALLVSAGSWLMFPRSFIYFGVLHGIALMLLVVRLTAHWGKWLWLLGALAILASFPVAYLLPASGWEGALNSAWLNWLGLVTRKPVTEDYVPIVPWLGLMWWGVASGRWLLERRPDLLAWRAKRLGAALAALGRWSLAYYMLHQPVMVAALALLRYSTLALERSAS